MVCAALLGAVEQIGGYRFIEPGQFQEGVLDVTAEDIITNLPYRSGCGMWFDHHISNIRDNDFEGKWVNAPSAARVIYDYYGKEKLGEFEKLVIITDRIDSADLSRDEVINPDDYFLVSMTIDGKQPLDEPYWIHLIDLLQNSNKMQLMADAEVNRRCEDMHLINEEYGQVLNLYSDEDDNVLVTDLRKVWNGVEGNRFLAYVIFPKVNIAVRAVEYKCDPERAHISVAHSLFNKTSTVNVGELMSKYGGGGHFGAGSCRPYRSDSDRVLREIIAACKE
ncbi:MAG: hypothetical protein P9M15_05040 [Candidatus Electryoneaceae bacterium]|nr:hypothetical protein [Candidatus Electryoneaceae bacterium]